MNCRNRNECSRFSNPNRLAKKGLITTLAALLILAFLYGPPQAQAINIVMNFNSGASDYPAYDPDGSKLTALMSSVESYYQDIFEASGTLNVEFYYDNIDVLAVHNNKSTSGGKPTSCRIRVDTNRTWFFDETPLDNSEFNMTQTLYRDLTSTQKSNYFNGSPNNLLEVRYKGNDNGSGPAESSNGFDLWSIMLHEMGHGLGMTSAVAFWEAWWDKEYDIDPDLVWGSSTKTEVYSSSDVYHLAATSNMYPYSSVGQRSLPSATDIFSIETTANWGDTTIDLLRQDFYASGANVNFNNRDYWEGHQVPGSGDDTWVRHGRNATLTAGRTVNNLVISGGSKVYTGAYRLRADQNATLGDGSNTGFVEIDSNGEFQVDKTLTIYNGSKVYMDSNSLLDVDTLNIYSGGEVRGTGTIDIEDGLNVTGRITVTSGTLVIDSDVAVNLDGNGNGELYVTGGNFICNKALSDSHDGYIEIAANRIATFTEGFVLNAGGEMYMDNLATIGGGLTHIRGELEIGDAAGDTAIVDGDFLLTSSGKLIVHAYGYSQGTDLDVLGTATIDGDLEVEFEYTPTVGDGIVALWYDTLVGTFDNVYATDPSIELTTSYYAHGMAVFVASVGGMAAVPEPGMLALLMGPLGFLLFSRRRRRA